jgi:ABC-type multidrug transport system ATPase subunit
MSSSAAAATLVQPITLSFTDITVGVSGKRNKAVAASPILENVCGLVSPGQSLGILGPSGSGKTTLINVLANRRHHQSLQVSGKVEFNGQVAKSRSRKRFSSLVAQDDTEVFMGDFTVRETLVYAARLEFGWSKAASLSSKVENVVVAMGLLSCADCRVGSVFFKGISGGQRRRLAIAVEMLKNPSILFLDEPLSNLDSASAFSILGELNKLTKRKHTIVFSAHTPSSRLFECFDLLMVLCAGKTVFWGPAKGLAEYLNRMPSSLVGGFGKLPDHYNPCDFAMYLLSDSAQAEHMCKEFTQSLECVNIMTEIRGNQKARVTLVAQLNRSLMLQDDDKDQASRGCCNRRKKDALAAIDPDSVNNQEFTAPLANIFTLSVRAVWELWRNPGILFVRIGLFVALGFTLGATYFAQCNGTSYANVRTCLSLLMGSTAFSTMMSITAIPFVCEDTKVYSKERHNGAYGSWVFAVTMTLRAIVVALILSLTVSVLVVFMSGIPTFGYFFLVMWVTLFFAESFAVLCAMATKGDYVFSVIVAMGCFALFMILSGFFITFDNIPWTLKWLAYASPLRYAFRAMIVQEYGTNPSLDPTSVFANGSAVLDFFGATNQGLGYWEDLIVVGGMGLVCFGFVGIVFEKRW